MPVRISLSNRLALLFFAITLLAIGSLYLYVAPGLQTRLLDEQFKALRSVAARDAAPVAAAIGTSIPVSEVRARVDRVALDSGDRVTLLLVSRTARSVTLSTEADSQSAAPSAASSPLALVAARAGTTTSGMTSGGPGAFAAIVRPVTVGGRVAAVILISVPVTEIVRNVAIVRHEILVAGAISVMLALVGGYGVARALSRRVKRLERAAERVAAGDFENPVPVDSQDELGQVAIAFNEMQRQLGELDLARKKFIATASHELRTPIFSLGGFVELLEDEDLDEETRRRFFEQLREQVTRLRRLSVNLLDLSRLEAGSLELRPENVDIGELVRSVSGEFEPSLAHHDSHLELRLAHGIEVQCDPVRVAQIVRILIDNALTHTVRGSRITLTAAREDTRLRVAVRDDGGGISSATLRRVFEPFYTGDGTQGSGLGLAIAGELAERMSGRLAARSQPGETVFTLELPA